MSTLADLADVTRWKTSCCGIDPSIIVTQAPMKVSQVERPSVGKNSSLPASTCVIHDDIDAAGHARDDAGDVEQAAADHAHLHEVEDGDKAPYTPKTV